MKLNLDVVLLEQQLNTLAAIIGRCDDDADSSAVIISYEDAEDLNGTHNLLAGIRDNVSLHAAAWENTLIPARQLVEAARALRSESGENPEYDRALVELVMDSAGQSMDKEAVYDLLGIQQPDVVN